MGVLACLPAARTKNVGWASSPVRPSVEQASACVAAGFSRPRGPCSPQPAPRMYAIWARGRSAWAVAPRPPATPAARGATVRKPEAYPTDPPSGIAVLGCPAPALPIGMRLLAPPLPVGHRNSGAANVHHTAIRAPTSTRPPPPGLLRDKKPQPRHSSRR